MRKYPVHFRQEEVHYVTTRWHAAESVSLVGVGSVGKSNLLHHLSDEDVHQHYLQDRAKNIKAIMIDPNLLAPIEQSATEQFRCWAGYELMMHRLYLAFYPFDVLGEYAEEFFHTYQALQDGNNPLYAYMGLRYFELGLEYFLRHGWQLIFMFDEFEELLRLMPPKFFQTLRGLRDNYKTQLSYLTFSREPLNILIDKFEIDPATFEPFSELFTDNVRYVGPNNQTDAQAMISNLLRRTPEMTLTDQEKEFLLYASGRFAGLLRATFRSFEEFKRFQAISVTDGELVKRLASRRPVKKECATIWTSLTVEEQALLKAIATRRGSISSQTRPEDVIHLLVQKRLLRTDQKTQQLRIDPPLFRAYIENDLDIDSA